jgi:hypothetical protein
MAPGENPRLHSLEEGSAVHGRGAPTRLDHVAMFPVASLSFFVFFILFFALLSAL